MTITAQSANVTFTRWPTNDLAERKSKELPLKKITSKIKPKNQTNGKYYRKRRGRGGTGDITRLVVIKAYCIQ